MVQKATFGAGCFWGVEQRFRALPGVVDAAVGYMGGDVDHPTYEQVCTDQTGHVEVVEVTFDESQISYADLVQAFFDLHDPTQVNRQGPDVGWQYRSVIFVHDDTQRATATAVRDALDASDRFATAIATQIEPAAVFWRAEEYHQQYLARRGGTCSI